MHGRADLSRIGRKIGAWIAVALVVAFGLGALHENAAGRHETAEGGRPAATTIIVRVIGPALL